MPKVGVHGLIVDDRGNILLVRRNYLAFDWLPPGGRMEANESIDSALVREVLEETGYLVEADQLVAIASRARTDDVIIALSAHIRENRKSTVDPTEIAAVGFFPRDQLPTPMKPEVLHLLNLYFAGERGSLLSFD